MGANQSQSGKLSDLEEGQTALVNAAMEEKDGNIEQAETYFNTSIQFFKKTSKKKILLMFILNWLLSMYDKTKQKKQENITITHYV